jgi:predicted small secreted protein
MMMRTRTSLSLLAPLLFLVQGCNTYSYFDIDLKLGAGFNTVTKGQIHDCHVFVTGAASDDFHVDAAKCQNVDPATLLMDKIEYSTFADAGNITFTLKLFKGLGEMTACEMGEAGTTLAVQSGKTIAGSISVPYAMPANCP